MWVCECTGVGAEKFLFIENAMAMRENGEFGFYLIL